MLSGDIEDSGYIRVADGKHISVGVHRNNTKYKIASFSYSAREFYDAYYYFIAEISLFIDSHQVVRNAE